MAVGYGPHEHRSVLTSSGSMAITFHRDSNQDKKRKMSIRNYKGETISGVKELTDPKYGTGDKGPDGSPRVNWKYLERADNDGFDIDRKDAKGRYRFTITLPAGTRLLRYGNEIGHFTAPAGTPYEQLSLPYKKETVEYHEYEVIADGLTVTCIVEKGIVAKGFGMPGGAVQYLHTESMHRSVRKHILKRIELWGVMGR